MKKIIPSIPDLTLRDSGLKASRLNSYEHLESASFLVLQVSENSSELLEKRAIKKSKRPIVFIHRDKRKHVDGRRSKNDFESVDFFSC